MIASGDDDVTTVSGRCHRRQKPVVSPLHAVRGGCVVENVACDDQAVNCLGADRFGEPGEKFLEGFVSVDAVETAAEMQIGSVKKTHESHKPVEQWQ